MWALVVAGCSSSEAEVRIWEMGDHAADAHSALSAAQLGDLGGVRRAAEGIARPDPAPGLPERGRAPLDEVRERGRELAGSPDLASAARTLGALTEPCAVCHVSFGVTGSADPAVEPLWSALVFESEALWQEGAADLPQGPVLAAGRAWSSRREVVARLLGEGRL